MGTEAVETVCAFYGFNWADAGGRRDGIAVIVELIAPDFEYQLDPIDLGQTLRGLADLTRFLEAIEEDFRDFHQTAEELFEVDGRVVVLGDLVGRGRLSGVPFHTRFGHIWTMRDGKAIRLEGYLHPSKALAAVGVGASTQGSGVDADVGERQRGT